MPVANWGMANNGGFQNALAMGMQMGAQVRQAREQKDYRNALAQFDPSNPETLKPIMAVRPEVGIQLRGQVQEQVAATELEAVAQRALAGDNQALGVLFTRAPDMWKRLDDRQRQGVKDATTFMAQRGMEIGRLPEDQRSQAWAASVQQAEASGIDIPTYMEAYTPDVLSAALARAEMTQKYIQMFEPDFRVIPQGGYLEDVNPLTRAPQQQGQAAPQGVSVGTFYGVFDVQGPEGAVRWSEQNPVRVSTPQEAASLPRGTRLILPDGSEGRVQ